jgi:hypothetical protein
MNGAVGVALGPVPGSCGVALSVAQVAALAEIELATCC